MYASTSASAASTAHVPDEEPETDGDADTETPPDDSNAAADVRPDGASIFATAELADAFDFEDPSGEKDDLLAAPQDLLS